MSDMLDRVERMNREALTEHQLGRLRAMLRSVVATNPFYRHKLRACGLDDPRDIRTFEDYRALPHTTRQELSVDQDANPPYGTNLTFPLERYTRLHQTSGVSGRPLRWLDTPESWDWLVDSWARAYRAAEVSASDRVFLAFSFGPFTGLWCAFEAAARVGALVIPGGAMSSEQRARLVVENDVTVLACTPTYALRLADAAARIGIRAADTAVRVTLHGGEPGASIPATKRRIEDAWSARCFDHAGATEVGSWGFECGRSAGLHVDESAFLCEVVDPVTGADSGEGELVMTNLGRVGKPVVRYRTGDWVRRGTGSCACGRIWMRCDGGVIGRADDALVIRGVVVFPSALEELIRRHPNVVEFAVEVARPHELDELTVRLELADGAADVPAKVAAAIRNTLGLTARVAVVPGGTLPVFELKARRVTDARAPAAGR